MKSPEGSALERLVLLPLDDAFFLYLNGMKMSLRGTHGFSSLRRLSAMFSNTASIFSITIALVDKCDDAIEGLIFNPFSHEHSIQLLLCGRRIVHDHIKVPSPRLP